MCVLGGGAFTTPDAAEGGAGDGADDDFEDFDDVDDTDVVDDVRAAVALLGLGELHVHRLGLRPPLGTAADGDLVAALSELVGFDPGPGVQCLAPLPLPTDPARAAIERAVWRIAQVYSLPVQRYRCLELSVVELAARESGARAARRRAPTPCALDREEACRCPGAGGSTRPSSSRRRVPAVQG